MESLREVLKHPAELYYLVKLKMALRGAEKHIPPEPHWAFCYTMVCVFYLVLRVLDTIEDDTSIPTAVKVPMLIDFYRHLNDIDWHYSCCTRNLDKVVVDEFHHVSTAFMELEKGHRETIVDFTKRMGAGMAKFICKEKATTDDYDEYCHYSAELVEIGLFKLFNPSRKQDPHLEKLCGSTFIFYQKRDMIEDYLEDINEIPKPRIFWPREIYSKYVDNIKDLKCEENSIKAVQCLNEMVTDALKHAGDCLNHLSTLNDDAALQFFGALAVKGMGTLVLCYNNIQVFKDKVRLRRGKIYYFSFAVRLYEQTKTMSDIYNVFFEFASVMKSKITTTYDYDEYCHYSAELVEIGLFKLFDPSRKQDLIMEKLCGSTFIFYQAHMIKDYLEDINEIPKPRIFWPREIYSKYVDKIEDLKCEENSVKAVQCLNEMVTDALKHTGDCLNHLSTLNDDAALQFFGALAVKGMGTLVLCYNNIQVFKDKVKLRRGLAARLYEQTKMMSDIYNVYFEFSSVMKSKVEMHDPNAMKTLSELNKIQEVCKKSGLLNTRFPSVVIVESFPYRCLDLCDGCLNGCRATWVREVWLFMESYDRLYLDRRTLIVGGSSCDHYHWAREAFKLSKNNSHPFYLLQKKLEMK
ncbi:hypothetical protein ACOSQ3_005778 [Xanthoceras sorbifolium]